jgi:RIO kinase 1
MRIPDSLYSLVEHGILEEVVRPLMSGKEAQVYLVISGGEQRVAKIYKEAQNRTFQKRAEYTEGRKVRNSRDQRAMSKNSRHGRAQNEAAWRSTEVDMIYRLQTAGVRVPVPHYFIDGVLIMELVKDAEGFPAPRLGDLTWEPEDAIAVYEQLIAEVVRMLSAGVVHGDLSDFNVLMGADGPVVIDFPQAVDASTNQNARKLLLRDVDNLHRFVAKFAPAHPVLPYAQEMWELYKRNALTPDTRLSGRYRVAQKAADTTAVMDLISDAAKDERRRREQLGLSMRGGPREAAGDGRAPAAPREAHDAPQLREGQARPRFQPPAQAGQRTDARPRHGEREPNARREGEPRVERPARDAAPRDAGPRFDRGGREPNARREGEPRVERPARDAAPRDANPRFDRGGRETNARREGEPRVERPAREAAPRDAGPRFDRPLDGSARRDAGPRFGRDAMESARREAPRFEHRASDAGRAAGARFAEQPANRHAQSHSGRTGQQTTPRELRAQLDRGAPQNEGRPERAPFERSDAQRGRREPASASEQAARREQRRDFAAPAERAGQQHARGDGATRVERDGSAGHSRREHVAHQAPSSERDPRSADERSSQSRTSPGLRDERLDPAQRRDRRG